MGNRGKWMTKSPSINTRCCCCCPFRPRCRVEIGWECFRIGLYVSRVKAVRLRYNTRIQLTSTLSLIPPFLLKRILSYVLTPIFSHLIPSPYTPLNLQKKTNIPPSSPTLIHILCTFPPTPPCMHACMDPHSHSSRPAGEQENRRTNRHLFIKPPSPGHKHSISISTLPPSFLPSKYFISLTHTHTYTHPLSLKKKTKKNTYSYEYKTPAATVFI